MFWRNFTARGRIGERGAGRSILGVALIALLVLSACTFTIQPQAAGTGAATATPQEEAGASSDLVGPTWQWIQTKYGDDSVLTATVPSNYTLQFNNDGTVAAQLDCNSGGGTYTVDGSSLTFGPMATTLMACPDGSQDSQFGMDLAGVVSYMIQDGHLFLALKVDTGIMEFAPAQASGEATAEATEEAASSDLVGPTWQWVQTQYGDGKILKADDPSRYTLLFSDDGTVAVQLDCNSGSGTYTTDGSSSLSFGPIASTLMACADDSQADDFAKDLGGVVSYVMQDGHLFLAIKFDTGIMEFAPAEASGAATSEATAEPTEEATEEATAEATEEPTEEAGGVLTGTTWLWEQTVISDVVVTPTDSSRYTITFNDDGTTNMQLDCNTGRATFTLEGANLTLGPIISTLMACPADTQDSVFTQNLQDTLSYSMGDGTLRLTLNNDGVMDFTEKK